MFGPLVYASSAWIPRRDSYEHETRTAETADVQPPRHPSSHAKDTYPLTIKTMTCISALNPSDIDCWRVQVAISLFTPVLEFNDTHIAIGIGSGSKG
jgi:hypothetical protein